MESTKARYFKTNHMAKASYNIQMEAIIMESFCWEKSMVKEYLGWQMEGQTTKVLFLMTKCMVKAFSLTQIKTAIKENLYKV